MVRKKALPRKQVTHREAGNPHDTATCEHISRMLARISDKWTLLVVRVLGKSPMRFNALRRANAGVTQKALTQCLRRLESNGFITRSVVSTAPVAVVYAIAPLGRSLEPHLRAILAWAGQHRQEVLAAQKAFAAQGHRFQ